MCLSPFIKDGAVFYYKALFGCLLWCCFFTLNSYAQTRYTVSGTITDAQTGESLIGATIKTALLKKGAVTNDYCFYSLSLPEGADTLQFSYVGYQPVEIKLH